MRDYQAIGKLGAAVRWQNELPFEQKFWARVQKGQPDECWPWTGAIASNGYGKVNRNYRTLGTHRVAFELQHGKVPDGKWILHRCDNPPCCNPNHLFAGTPKDNVTDCFLKNRHPGYKLSDRIAKKIRRRKAIVAITQCQLAKEFGVSQSHISRIVNLKRHSHLCGQ